MTPVNAARGEVALVIGGKTYPVALTLDAMARIAATLGIATLDELGSRVIELRPGDMLPVARALLTGNGHDADAIDLGRVHWTVYAEVTAQVWNAKPHADEDASASPPKRAS